MICWTMSAGPGNGPHYFVIWVGWDKLRMGERVTMIGEKDDVADALNFTL